MRRNRSEGESAPMTLGQALAAKVRLLVWCASASRTRSGERGAAVGRSWAVAGISPLP
jgi:hypothetical protein